MTKAQQVIDFIQCLHGMDQIYIDDNCSNVANAAIDLESGAVISVLKDDSNCETLNVNYPGGAKVVILAYKFIDMLLVRHSRAMELTNPEGGKAVSHYNHIKDHLYRKTGFGF